ncbi:MAG: hypothetical protein GEV11_04740 [Streptosporangiales bacterium]|nr:hypothetical protein [Streptosporangiales bacterium]
MDPRLAAVAAANGGPFRVGEALRAGYTEGKVRHLVSTGAWTRLRRGICVETALLERCDPVHRHALHVAGAVLALGGTVVCSHESAALLHDVALLDRPAEDEVTLTRPDGSSHRDHVRGARIHLAQVSPRHVERLFGMPITGAARTVVDLARWLPFEAAVVAADAAMYRLAVDRAELAKIIGECAGWRGVPRATRVLEAADPRARSPLETLGRLMCAEAGLPAPMVSTYIGDERGPYTEVDLYWPDSGVIVLFDGMVKYDDPRANRNEKLIQARLENDGFIVVRLAWADVTRRRAESVSPGPVPRKGYSGRLDDGCGETTVEGRPGRPAFAGRGVCRVTGP